MNTKDSIELAEKLSKEYGDLEKMDREIRDKEKVLERPVMQYREPMPDASLFEAGMHVVRTVIEVFTILFFDAFLLLGAMVLDWDTHSSRYQIAAWIVVLISNIGLAALGSYNKHRREQNERKYLEEQRIKQESYILQRRADLRKEVAELYRKQSEVKGDLLKYEDQIPPEYRTRYHMVRVKKMLQNGKAQNFDEAIGFLVQSAK